MTDKDFSLLTTPVPLHFLHGSTIVLPVPEQFTQALSIVKKPWLLLTFPLPPQVPQDDKLAFPPVDPLPLQLSHLDGALIFIVLLVPK